MAQPQRGFGTLAKIISKKVRRKTNMANLKFTKWYAGHYHVEGEESRVRIMFEEYEETV